MNREDREEIEKLLYRLRDATNVDVLALKATFRFLLDENAAIEPLREALRRAELDFLAIEDQTSKSQVVLPKALSNTGAIAARGLRGVRTALQQSDRSQAAGL